jgi:hypothetical protein
LDSITGWEVIVVGATRRLAMARKIYADTKYVMLECGASLREAFQMGDQWLDEHDVWVENVIVTKDDCLGEWFIYIYYREEENS